MTNKPSKIRNSRRVFFPNARGVRLCGIVEHPPGKPAAVAIFTHCFTCTKDLKAIVRISRALAARDVLVLRFDFTGLGESHGNFSATNFDSNLSDVRAAADYLAQQHDSPNLLIGHSLGGAAITTVAPEIDSVQAIVTIAAPASTRHLADYLTRANPDIVESGEGVVEIGGRRYVLKRQLIDNLRAQDLEAAIRRLRIPHLIFHSPADETLPYWHAEQMFKLSGGPKSMITLDGSDHLLVRNEHDVVYVADIVATWSKRYLPDSPVSTK